MPETIEKPLRDVLGEEASDSLVRFVDQKLDQRKHEMLEFIEEKFERRLSEEHGQINLAIKETEQRLDNRITEEIAKINERITTEISKVNERITEEIAGVKNQISDTRADLIKWMFIFWVGQVAVIMGLLFAFFK